LIDIRREVREEEAYLASQATDDELLVVLTKGDQVPRNGHEKAKKGVATALDVPMERVFVSSLVGKFKQPIDPIREKLAEAIPTWSR
jgi:GTP-binding protein EngB required for normal cell division